MSTSTTGLPARTRRGVRRTGRNIFVWLLAWSIIAGISVFALFYAYYSTRAGLIGIDIVKQMPKASLLYDEHGKSFSRFFEENRIAMPANKPVPKLLGQAVVATEDRRFYEHGAIDPYGIVRAAFSNLLRHGSRQGGSSITQQLARNSIGHLERTYDRKFLEIFLAHRIEANYTKEQILRYYLDRIYFGQGLYGAETTAYAFFGVSVEQLNLAQCALLAGMISSPNASSPWKDIKAAKAARDRALERMVKANYITDAQAKAASRAALALRPRPDFGGGFATSEVRRQLESILDDQALQQGGLKIFTTIDSHLQTVAENALAARIDEIERAKGESHAAGYGDPNTGLPDPDVLEGAFFAMDPSNGAVRAIVGSRDFALSQYNRAVQARRQIGSTVKPLIYAVAFAEKGYCPASVIDATPFNLKSSGPIPVNDEGERNMMRINDALAKSDDYAAPRMGEIVGYDLLNSYAHQCGITTTIPSFRSSFLGAFDLSLNELTGVYATFANEGVWVRQHIVVQVRDSHDRIIYQYQPETHRVFTPQVARQVTGMMENVINFGTGAPIRQEFGFNAPAAGKTGTTNDYKDAWFEGFTTHLVAGVWIGYDQPRQVLPGGYAARIALPVWANVMKQMQSTYTMQPFPVPPGLIAVNVGGFPFGRGETYYLTPEQRNLLNTEPEESNNDRSRSNSNIFQRFFDLFR
jgi:penicillin-binding protein 1A